MERTLRWFGDDLQIDHTLGDPDNYGDMTFTASPEKEHFNLDMDRSTGRDRDNYDSSDHTWIDLNKEEALELHALLTAWLEQQS